MRSRVCVVNKGTDHGDRLSDHSSRNREIPESTEDDAPKNHSSQDINKRRSKSSHGSGHNRRHKKKKSRSRGHDDHDDDKRDSKKSKESKEPSQSFYAKTVANRTTAEDGDDVVDFTARKIRDLTKERDSTLGLDDQDHEDEVGQDPIDLLDLSSSSSEEEKEASSWEQVFSKASSPPPSTSRERTSSERTRRKRKSRSTCRSKTRERSPGIRVRVESNKNYKDPNRKEQKPSWYDLPPEEDPNKKDPVREMVNKWVQETTTSEPKEPLPSPNFSQFKVPVLPSESRTRDRTNKVRDDRDCDRSRSESDSKKQSSSNKWNDCYKDYDTDSDEEYDYYGTYREKRRKVSTSRDDHDMEERLERLRRRRINQVYERSFSRSMSRARSVRSVSRARRIYTEEEKIDKAKLLAIARANLAEMMIKGTLPASVDVDKFKLRHLKELSATKSVKEYTEFCRAISAMEAAAYSDSSLSGSDDSDEDVRSVITEVTFSKKHPFVLKERKEIAIHVKDFVSRPTRTAQEIQEQNRRIEEEFPVSSGERHRNKEWQDVTQINPQVDLPSKAVGKKKDSKSREQPDDSLLFKKPNNHDDDNAGPSTSDQVVFDDGGITPEPDIGMIMSQRMAAKKILESDPFNLVALKQLNEAQSLVGFFT